jgi:hypothetical protein
MKKLFPAVLLLGLLPLLHADNVLKNSDFADGPLNWKGDGRTPADMKPEDSLDNSTSPYGDKGLVIPLKPHAWTKVVQEFRTPSSAVTLALTYKIAPNTVFSTSEEDYKNVPNHIDFNGWKPFDGKVGGWMVMLSDFSKGRIFANAVIPAVGNGEQNSTGTFDSLTPDGDKTICLAFPPGTGAVILLNVTLNAP